MLLKIDTTKREEVIVSLSFPRRRESSSRIKSRMTVKTISLVQTQKPGSQVLLPIIIKILKKNKASFSDLTAVEVNPGPGSFTGTRVGVSVANALGFALNIPINKKKGKIVIPVYEKSKFD